MLGGVLGGLYVKTRDAEAPGSRSFVWHPRGWCLAGYALVYLQRLEKQMTNPRARLHIT